MTAVTLKEFHNEKGGGEVMYCIGKGVYCIQTFPLYSDIIYCFNRKNFVP